jgi:V/A-type H+/Na+-transporting ATPase subunit E
MATTLEEFVAQLHTDGVESGRIEAEKLVEEARRHADALRREAAEKARAVVAEAEAHAALLKMQAGTELRLASRDTLLQLRESLTVALDGILKQALAPQLTDAGVLAPLLREVVVQYARGDAAGERHIVIDVPDHLSDDLGAWLMQELGRSVEGHETYIDVRGILSEAGFEYRVSGGKVDMTLNAVADVLRAMVRPRLWEVLASVAAEHDAAEQPAGRPGAEAAVGARPAAGVEAEVGPQAVAP